MSLIKDDINYTFNLFSLTVHYSFGYMMDLELIDVECVSGGHSPLCCCLQLRSKSSITQLCAQWFVHTDSFPPG